MGVESTDGMTPEERAAFLLSKMKNRTTAITGKPVERESIAPKYDADLIPDIEPGGLTPEQIQQDALIDSIDIVDAYTRFIGKMTPDPKGRTESIMISCPTPGHADANPSAWMNSDKKTWFCGGCQVGGDLYDLAAIHFGIDYKSDPKNLFPVLKDKVAEAYGFRITYNEVTKQETVSEIIHEPDPEPTPPSLTVVPEPDEDEEDHSWELELDASDIRIEWDQIIPPNTFMYEWMTSLCIDAVPHEYHFWTGVMALGFASNRQVTLRDKIPVKGNLFVCLYGPTGSGKTQAIYPLRRLIEETLPWQEDPISGPTGVKVVPMPASGEGMIDSFRADIKDPSTMKTIDLKPVSGMLIQNEFSSLIARGERQGSTMSDTVIDMYDAVEGFPISTNSRTSGVVSALSPYMSIITSTQPKRIKSFLRKTDLESGLLNRFIIAGGVKRMKGQAVQDDEPDLTAAIDFFRNLVNANKGERQIPLRNSAAYPLLQDFYTKYIEPYQDDPDQDGVFARIDLTLKKLILAFCINENKTEPDADLMERVLRLYPYLRVTYSHLTDTLHLTDTGELEDKIKTFCALYEKKHGKPAANRDIVRHIGKKFTLEDQARAMKNLIAMEQIKPVEFKPTRGPATTRFQFIGL